MPLTLQLVTDTSSAKAYTADDKDSDLRCKFTDELQISKDHSDTDAKAQQTLISNGVIRTERMCRDDDGHFRLVKTPKAGRVTHVTCTNDLDNVPAPIKSRACIVAVAAQSDADRSASASTLASVGSSVKSIAVRDAFSLFCQTLACMQVCWGRGMLTAAAACFQ
jgi:hypothetical protein